jgi:hypothetical protein
MRRYKWSLETSALMISTSMDFQISLGICGDLGTPYLIPRIGCELGIVSPGFLGIPGIRERITGTDADATRRESRRP